MTPGQEEELRPQPLRPWGWGVGGASFALLHHWPLAPPPALPQCTGVPRGPCVTATAPGQAVEGMICGSLEASECRNVLKS